MNDTLSWPTPAVRSTTILRWSFPAELGGLTLQGTSVAADHTSFSIPELNWMLDAGVLVDTQRPTHIFVSHTHTDHVHMLTHLKTRRKPPKIYAPAACAPMIETYLSAAQAMTANILWTPEVNWTRAYDMVPVTGGQRLDLTRGKKKYVAEVFDCDHTLPCVGYIFSEVRRKLKTQYADTPGHELGALRAKGIDISEETPIPLFAYLGDTRPSVYESAPEIFGAPVVIAECSFISDDHKAHAQRTGHTVWSDLLPIVEAHPETIFVLIHFSKRHREHELRAFFEQHAPPNVVPWINGNAQPQEAVA